MKKLTFISLLLLVFSLITRGQEKDLANKYVSDFNYFIERLTETHPDPYSGFGGKVEFYRVKQKIQEDLKSISSDFDFVVKINQFLSRLEDGHTHINFPRNFEGTDIKKLPVSLKSASDYLFIQNSTGIYRKYIGKPINAINDIAIELLVNKIKELYPTENISGAYHNLTRSLRTDLSSKILLGTSDTLHFSLGFPEDIYRVDIPFQSDVIMESQKSIIAVPNNNGLLYWDMIGNEENIGYFVWNSILSREVVEQIQRDAPKWTENNLRWVYGYMNSSIPEDINEAIKKIPSLYEQFYLLFKKMNDKKSKYLIIDLRKNAGGMTPLVNPLLYMIYGDHYLNFKFNAEYITKISPLYLKKRGVAVDSMNTGERYRFSNFGGFKSTLSLPEKREIAESGYGNLGTEYIKKVVKDFNIKPEIIVLTSPSTFSAAYHFTYFLKKLGRATIIGVASRQAGNAFMEQTSFRLPETNLRGSISNSVQILFKSDPESGKLLRPDYEMAWKDFKRYGFDRNAEVLMAIDLIENDRVGPSSN